MTTRHAAAFALVGWFLIAPTPSMLVNGVRPLSMFSKWQIVDSFESLEDCQLARQEVREQPHPTFRKMPSLFLKPGSSRDNSSDPFYWAQCVDETDPRMKARSLD